MPSRFITAAALALISISTGAAAVSCGVCAPTIVYAGLNRTLTLQREEGSNTVQCKCVLGLLPPRHALIYPFSAATTLPPFQDSRLAASTEYIFCMIYLNVVLND
jgi:hypothetical protein